MTWRLSAFLPRRISSQIAALIVVSLLAIHLVVTAAFVFLRPPDRSGPPDAALDRLVTIARLLDAAPPEARGGLLTTLDGAYPQMGLSLSRSSQESVRAPRERRLDGLRHRLGPGFSIAFGDAGIPGAKPARDLVSIRLQDGAILTAWTPPLPPLPIGGPFLITLGSIAICIGLLGWWAARSLTLPLRSFARAAENFSPEGEIAPLPERGPYEIKTAARALNHMRERIKALVDDRTRMLAAVGHDLRTPITRLRLRSEFIEDDSARAEMLRDLDQMNAMVESVLLFLQNGKAQGVMTTIDLASNLQTICDQFADMQHTVSYLGPDHLLIRARPEALDRAVTNLVENAVRYGGGAVVRLTAAPGGAEIAVEDDGPGIPDSQKEVLQEPFVRGDAARGMNKATGFGLGLAIARAVAEKHGGTLELINRRPTGLKAKITLPDTPLAGDGREMEAVRRATAR
jgi:signal transduction histidine kinase